MDIDNGKHFATRANLEKHLKAKGLDDMKPLICRNTSGRWTAVFGLNVSGMQRTGNVMLACHFGYITIN